MTAGFPAGLSRAFACTAGCARGQECRGANSHAAHAPVTAAEGAELQRLKALGWFCEAFCHEKRNQHPRRHAGEVSELLHVGVRTLANWRSDGKGPAFIRTGDRHSPVLYREPDVAAWIDSRRVRGGE